jgi:hypothetical protein
MYCIYLGKAVQTVNPPNSSVGTSQLDSSLDFSSKTITLASNMKNTPAFEAKLGSVQDIGSSGVFTKINYDTETFDVGSNYDTTNKRFLPTTAGKYFVYFSLHLYGDIGNTISDVRATIYKNGSEYTLARTEWVSTSIDFSGATMNGFATMELNGSSDYVEIYGFSQDVDVGSTDISQTKSLFGAYKLIGV